MTRKPALIAQRTRRMPDPKPVDKLITNPDCGLRHAPVDVARARSHAMVERAAEALRALSAPAPASAGGESTSDPRRQTQPDQTQPDQTQPDQTLATCPEPSVEQGV